MQKIDVSVLITCYNKEKYLDECVNSVLRQTKQPKEIIIVHDCCKNPVHHAKATSIFLKDNLGVALARNVAVHNSTGKLLLFLDADDMISPDYLEKMTLVISKGADAAYPDIYLWAGKHSQLTITPKKLTKEWIKKFEKVIIPVTSLMKREMYERLDGFKEMPVLEDLDFWVRAIKVGFILRKAETLLWYRKYPETRNSLNVEKRKIIFERIIKQL